MATLQNTNESEKRLADDDDEDFRQKKLLEILNQIDLAIIKIDALISREELSQ